MIAPAQGGPPPDFVAPHGGDAVFVHLTRVEHRLALDPTHPLAVARSVLEFRTDRPGHPVILCPDAAAAHAWLDGRPVTLDAVAPAPGSAALRVSDRFVEPGSHVFAFDTDLRQTTAVDGTVPVRFGRTGVELHFPMSDAHDHGFLEQFLPTNLEFDVHDVTLLLALTGLAERHVAVTNGALALLHDDTHAATFRIDFSRVRSSSTYLHVLPRTAIVHRAFDVPIDNCAIPVFLYTRAHDRTVRPPHHRELDLAELTTVDLDDFEERITFALVHLLVPDLGPYPEPSLVVYARPEVTGRGMEYKGAVESTQDALLHELVHLWWGRYLSPSSGRDGWIDEAVATWYAKGLLDVEWPPFGLVDLRGRDPYLRSTPPEAYDEGALLVGYLHHLAQLTHGPRGLLEVLGDARRRLLTRALDTEALFRGIGDLLAPEPADCDDPGPVDRQWIRDLLDQHVLGGSPFDLRDRRRREAHRPAVPPELAEAAHRPGAPWLTRAIATWATDGAAGKARRWPDAPPYPTHPDPGPAPDPADVDARAVQVVQYLHYLLYEIAPKGDRVSILKLLASSEVDWDTLDAAVLRRVLETTGFLTYRLEEAIERYVVGRPPKITARGFRRKLHRIGGRGDGIGRAPDGASTARPVKEFEPKSARFRSFGQSNLQGAHLARSLEGRAADARGLSLEARLRGHQADVLRLGRRHQPGEAGTWFAGGPPKHWGINFAFTRPAATGDTKVYYVYGEVPSYEYFDAYAPTPWQWRQYVPEQQGLTFDEALDHGGAIWLADRANVGLSTTKITLYVRSTWFNAPVPNVAPKTYG